MRDDRKLSRRRILIKGAVFVAGAVVGPALTGPRALAAKAAKSDFYYQDTPKNGQSCANCRMFVAQPGGKGSCALIEGDVAPSGWCMAYSPRNSGA